MIIQFHILQNYAPSNLNRDENNRPKSAFFGGMERGRVSSQSLKRAMRWSEDWWRGAFNAEILAERIKLPRIIHEQLVEMRDSGVAIDDTALDAIVKRAPDILKKSDDDQGKPDTGQGSQRDGEVKENKTEDDKPKGVRRDKTGKTKSPEEEAEDILNAGQLVYIAPNECRPLAELLWKLYQQNPAGFASLDLNQKLKECKFKLKPRSVDIAMFGRMITSNAFENVQASVQVAHAISTHKMQTETDYFTALDDRLKRAGMIGDTEFNSGTYYRYINIFWKELLDNLGGEVDMARKAAVQLLQAAISVHPTGKINTFANFQLPDFVLVEVREKNLPLSYANAFRKPLCADKDNDNDLMVLSQNALASYLGKMSQMYSFDDKSAFAASWDCVVPGAEKKDSIAELVKWLKTVLAAR